jgi:hypothetical protein
MALASVLAFSAVTALADGASVSGAWKVTGDVMGYPVEQVCTFAQDGKKLTGSCKEAGKDKAADITGEVEDKKVTWSFKTDYNGQEITVTFKGTLGDDAQLKGDIDVQPFNVAGTFSAKKEEAKKEEPKKPQ